MGACVSKVSDGATECTRSSRPLIWTVRTPVPELFALITAIRGLRNSLASGGDWARVAVGQAAHVLFAERLAALQGRTYDPVLTCDTAPSTNAGDGCTLSHTGRQGHRLRGRQGREAGGYLVRAVWEGLIGRSEQWCLRRSL
jgi:hypothetical protein